MLKNLHTTIFIAVICCCFNFSNTYSSTCPLEEELNVYKINLPALKKYDVIKRGTHVDLTLLNDISSNEDNYNKTIDLSISGSDNLNLKATGLVTYQKNAGRFSMHGRFHLSTDKLYLGDGLKINFSATSPELMSAHLPHPDTSSIRLARTITNASIAASPATFGASLGISFLLSGIIAAHQNGISDFVWGGLDGSGFSFLEHLLRKQPDLSLHAGTSLPFKLKEDLKISKGIHKENFETIDMDRGEALQRIKQLIQWGDLTGALEYSLKTNQKDIYHELIQKISS